MERLTCLTSIIYFTRNITYLGYDALLRNFLTNRPLTAILSQWRAYQTDWRRRHFLFLYGSVNHKCQL